MVLFVPGSGSAEDREAVLDVPQVEETTVRIPVPAAVFVRVLRVDKCRFTAVWRGEDSATIPLKKT